MATRTATQQCTHHWLIEGTDGPVSRGRCRKCGATREFANSWQTATSIPETKLRYGVHSQAAYDTSLMARCRVGHYGNRGID